MSSPQKQYLNLFSLTMIVVTLVIGMGIFKTPASVAAKAGTQTIFYLAWITGGIIALCGGLTYAEIGKRLPTIGGYYKIFAYCYHPAVGFTINSLILISNAASLAIVALIGSDYVSDLLNYTTSNQVFNAGIAITAVALFYGVNLLGLKTSSTTQNILAIIKIGLIIILITAIFKSIQVTPRVYNTKELTYYYNGNNGWLLFMLSLVAVSFTYGGYQQSINFGGEVKNSNTLQKGIVMGISIVLLLYVTLNYVYVEVIGFEKMKNANAIGALLCESIFGPKGAKVFDACMFLSVLAYVNVLLLSNPRVMYAMSVDGVLPKAFQQQTAKHNVLFTGLTVFSAITIIIIFFGDGVDDILGFTMFLDSMGMITSAATLFILRKQKLGDQNVSGFLKKLTPFLCVLFMLAYVVVATAVWIDNPKAAITAIVLLLIFTGLYFIFYHKKRLT